MFDYLRRGFADPGPSRTLPPGAPPADFRPGRAYWNQREILAQSAEHIRALSDAVGRRSDLSLPQFAQLMASVIDFAPDLVLELGRGLGNSTCAFTEAANQLGGGCRVLSLCNTDDWKTVTAPKVKALVEKGWFAPLDAITADILTYPFQTALAKAKRVVLFWDAHGFEIAEIALAVIMPLLAQREHLVFMHDMSDTRYGAAECADYAGGRLWTGENASSARFRVGIVDSAVAQAFVVQDFTQRNRITLDSVDHSIHEEFESQPDRIEEMRALLGNDLFSMVGHWFWFTLNEHPGPYTFPKRG